MSELLQGPEPLKEPKPLRGFKKAMNKYRLNRLYELAHDVRDGTVYEGLGTRVVVNGELSDGYEIVASYKVGQVKTEFTIRVFYDDITGGDIAGISAERVHAYPCDIKSVQSFDSGRHPDQNSLPITEVLDKMSFVASLSPYATPSPFDFPDIASPEFS